MRIRQSVCYPMVKPASMPIEDLFSVAAEIGFVAVEMWARGDDFEKEVTLAHRHNLAVAVMVGHASLTEGLSDRRHHDRIEKELRLSIDVAADNGIPGLICLAGNRIAGQSDDQASDAAADGLRRVAPYAEKRGINLNLELLNSKIDHPGYRGDHTAWGVAVCERVASERVKLLYDIYHMQIMEGDVIRTITQNIRRIGHFHTAGNPGRHDIDDTQELNYSAVASAIAATDYDGYVGHEFAAKGDVVDALRRAFAICDKG